MKNFRYIFAKHPDLTGKELINLLSRKDKSQVLVSFLDRAGDLIRGTDWGRSLIELGSYLDKREFVKGLEGGVIEVEQFFED